VVRAARAAIAAALAAGYTDPQLHHDARIAIKRWRYADESWAAALGAESRLGRRLRALQRALGVAQDAVTLRRLLEGISGAEILARRLAGEQRRALDRFRTLATDLAALPRRRRAAAGISARTPTSPAAARGRGSSPGR
jgi:CHAD domain-containing protein